MSAHFMTSLCNYALRTCSQSSLWAYSPQCKRLVSSIKRVTNFFLMAGSLSLDDLKACLLDVQNNPIAKRTHAAFLLRTEGSEQAALIVGEALKIRHDSALMRHELAYILGQMQHRAVCPLLESILVDESDDLIVRHESAEALGAIGNISSLPILKQYCTHGASEIAETCLIAVDLINWKVEQQKQNMYAASKSGEYLSVDPAPPVAEKGISVEELQGKLMNSELSLFDRYRAMFALRNVNTDNAAMAIVSGFKDSSPLFRHEVAYVLGQMQRSVTAEALSEVLRDKSEHAMVRHEAAEALGAIGGESVESLLREFEDDPEIMVKESCEVALNIIDYWSSNELNK